MEPKAFVFTEKLRAKWQERFWRCPVRLAEDLPGYWMLNGGARGSGSVTAVLPILCLHAWPSPQSEWTKWAYLSRRRIASLSGLCKDTVGRVLTLLQGEELLDLKRIAHPTQCGAYRTEYRLATAAFYPVDNVGGKANEPFVTIYGNLLYGGLWRLLPTPAARHLYLTIACLAPIRNPAAFRKALSKSAEDLLSEEQLAKKIKAYRKKHSLSLSALEWRTGLSRPTVIHALKILTTPIPWSGDSSRSYVRAGKRGTGRPTWFAPHRPFMKDTRVPFEILNDSERVHQLRQELWAGLIEPKVALEEARL